MNICIVPDIVHEFSKVSQQSADLFCKNKETAGYATYTTLLNTSGG